MMSLLAKRNRTDLHHPFHSILSDFFEQGTFGRSDFFKPTTVPAVNVKETESNWVIELAAQEMSKESFEVKIENNALIISGDTNQNEITEEDNYTRNAFSYQAFNRYFALPKNVNAQEVQAQYSDGVLAISLAKKAVSPRQAVKKISIY